MKRLHARDNRLKFQFGHGESGLFTHLLGLYPVMPPAHYRLSRAGGLPDSAASQKLLDEALAEQRAQCRRQVQALLKDPARFKKTPAGSVLTVTREEAEWLMQVLNDIRVGSWVLLGSPEDKIGDVTPETTSHIWALAGAGYFQMALLKSVEEAR